MANILWIIVAVLVAFWLVGIVLTLLGFLAHVIMSILHLALVAAVAIVIYLLITGRRRL